MKALVAIHKTWDDGGFELLVDWIRQEIITDDIDPSMIRERYDLRICSTPSIPINSTLHMMELVKDKRLKLESGDKREMLVLNFEDSEITDEELFLAYSAAKITHQDRLAFAEKKAKSSLIRRSI